MKCYEVSLFQQNEEVSPVSIPPVTSRIKRTTDPENSIAGQGLSLTPFSRFYLPSQREKKRGSVSTPPKLTQKQRERRE